MASHAPAPGSHESSAVSPADPNGAIARRGRLRRRRAAAGVVTASVLAGGLVAAGAAGGGKPGAPQQPQGQTQLPTTLEDFFQPGTQPEPDEMLFAPVIASTNCSFCHGGYYPEEEAIVEPHTGWTASLMGQSARDPVWQAALSIANQDANVAGEYCIRCHAPGAWLAGKSDDGEITDFETGFFVNDFDGVNCHFCHRAVNPVLEGDSPAEDPAVLAGLPFPPDDDAWGNGRFVVDPNDVRRGPYEDVATNPDMNLHGVDVIWSPWHQRSELCATCHEVRNPITVRQPDGSYDVATFGQPHPTGELVDMFPEQAVYSEWVSSDFANGGVEVPGDRFGGNHPTGLMAECQDCHMPDQIAGGCFAWQSPPFFERQDLGHHQVVGANWWVLRAVRAIYPDSDTGLTEQTVETHRQRTIDFLQAASDTFVQQEGDDIRVRVVNWTGHKLPTGYPEGRRMWINVRFLDDQDELVDEVGGYDLASATLDESETKVYAADHGIDETVSQATGLPVGKSFHLTLNNTKFKDNRIPPKGFSLADYEARGIAPVGATYADGQHWDDTVFEIPSGATKVIVNLYHQVMTREYMEFLRDANVTDNRGQTIYDLWADPMVGDRTPPLNLDTVMIDLGPAVIGDLDGDGMVGFGDLLILLTEWGPCEGPAFCPADLDGNGAVDFGDLLILLTEWG